MGNEPRQKTGESAFERRYWPISEKRTSQEELWSVWSLARIWSPERLGMSFFSSFYSKRWEQTRTIIALTSDGRPQVRRVSDASAELELKRVANVPYTTPANSVPVYNSVHGPGGIQKLIDSSSIIEPNRPQLTANRKVNTIRRFFSKFQTVAVGSS